VYRLTLDADGGVMHSLDYPASEIVPGGDATFAQCGLFGYAGTSWCLGVQHAFSPQTYKDGLTRKCAEVRSLRPPPAFAPAFADRH
jgi:hypothetical protein